MWRRTAPFLLVYFLLLQGTGGGQPFDPFPSPFPPPTTLPRHELIVTKSGAGSGSISADDCPFDCSSHFYNHNSTVTLNASASGGSTFANWSGEGCSGAGNCVVTMSQARTVTATFTTTGGTTYASENFDDVPDNISSTMRARGWDWEDAFNQPEGFGPRYEIKDIPGARSSAQSLRMKISENGESSIFPALPLSPEVNTGDEIYMRIYMKWESRQLPEQPYLFYPGSNEQKAFYLRAIHGGSQEWRNEIAINETPGSNRETGRLWVDLNVHLSADKRFQNVGPQLDVQPETWYCIEVYFLISSVNTADGTIRMWVKDDSGGYNGGAVTLISEHFNVNMRKPVSGASNPAAAANKFWLTSNYGGQQEDHPGIWIYYDEMIASSVRVGCS